NSSTIPTLYVQATSSQSSALVNVASSSGSSYFTVLANGNVGVSNASPSYALDAGGFARFGAGLRVEPTTVSGGGSSFYYYPNVSSYSYNGTSNGTMILNTNIASSSYEMFKIRLHGYGLNESSVIDFTVVGYSTPGTLGSISGTAGAVVDYSIIDNGNDGLPKWVGINSSGKVAVAVGRTSGSYYFYRLSADYWSTRQAVDASTGWSYSTSTTANFGWSDAHRMNPALTQLVNGNVGIGTSTPNQPLEIVANSGVSAQILGLNNDYGGTTGSGYFLSTGASSGNTYTILQSLNSGGGAGGVLALNGDGGNVGIGTTTPGSKFVVAATCTNFTTTNTCTDYAELYPSAEIMQAGDVAAVASSTASSSTPGALVQKSTHGYDSGLLGVVSTNPAIVIEGSSLEFMSGSNYQPDPMRPAIALAGRVPVKVTNENGNIQAGDFLTSSAEFPGYAMKATRSGYVLGRALSDFSGSASSTGGSVLMFVNPGFENINNTFVLGANDGQLASATSTFSIISSASSSDVAMLINQQGTGNLLQLQQNGQDRLLIANDGSMSLLASTTIATSTILSVVNGTTTQFSITAAGHITVGQDTAGTATIKAGDNQTAVTFAVPYGTTPKVIVTAQTLPNFFYGVATKTPAGFTIQISATSTADVSFDWVALAQPLDTPSQSSSTTTPLTVTNVPMTNVMGPNGQWVAVPVSSLYTTSQTQQSSTSTTTSSSTATTTTSSSLTSTTASGTSTSTQTVLDTSSSSSTTPVVAGTSTTATTATTTPTP
ncbi:MAG: hypothetical protein KGJ93_04085, partial [Patescibacteria group bacterium]|nr:hypothetical protein [Patescibacteria group bacterium]